LSGEGRTFGYNQVAKTAKVMHI